MKEKSDIMRELLKSLISFEKEKDDSSHDSEHKKNNQTQRGNENNNFIEDNIFNSNQTFTKVRKKIVKI